MIKHNFGFAFCRDKPTQEFEDILKNGIKRFKEKFPKEKIDYIECSLKDIPEKIIYDSVEVRPYRRWTIGTIWIKPIENGELNNE